MQFQKLMEVFDKVMKINESYLKMNESNNFWIKETISEISNKIKQTVEFCFENHKSTITTNIQPINAINKNDLTRNRTVPTNRTYAETLFK